MKICASIVALVFVLGIAASPASAQVKPSATKGNTCPEGFSACVDTCIKRGGQPRFCPVYCQKQKGC